MQDQSDEFTQSLGINAENFNTLKELLGEEFNQLLEEFVAVTPTSIAQLNTAQKNSDMENMLNLAHSLKGSSGNLGFEGFSNLCLNLEQQLKSDNQDNIENHVHQIEAGFDALSQYINQLVNT